MRDGDAASSILGPPNRLRYFLPGPVQTSSHILPAATEELRNCCRGFDCIAPFVRTIARVIAAIAPLMSQITASFRMRRAIPWREASLFAVRFDAL